jgi:hypothetical protein
MTRARDLTLVAISKVLQVQTVRLSSDATMSAPTSWTTINALPSQTGNSGKYLTTDGSSASWAVANTQSDNFSQFLLAGC